MKPFWSLLTLSLLVLLLSACSALNPPQVTPFIPTRSPTPQPSATIQWFPPTNTPTAFPTAIPRLPTPDQRPALGEIILRDAFDQPTGWLTGQFAAGTITLGKGRLDLVTQPTAGVSLVSLRSGALPADLYLEITAAVSLCRGKDSYGLIFRAEGEVSYYRLFITCDGQLRVERWRPAEVGVVQDWTPSGQVPAGAPVSLRIGVWLFRDEMRIFVNEVLQFSARDPLLSGSQVGVFARPASANPVSVSFSDLTVRAISGYLPSPVPSPTVFTIPTATRAPTFTPAP